MDSYCLNATVSVVDSMHSSKSCDLTPSPPIRNPFLAPVLCPRKLTDFSIRRILGLRTTKHTKKQYVLHRYTATTPFRLQVLDKAIVIPARAYLLVQTTQVSAVIVTASSIKYRHIPMKRQRTTFSPIQVLELERAYRRRPYLMSEDGDCLVQRLGITVKSLKYWFQNRRAKSRKDEEKMTSWYQSSSSNQFGRPVRRGVLSERQQFRIQSPPDQWKHTECTRMSYPALENHLKFSVPHSRPIRADYHYSSFKSNQLRGRSSLPVPMFHPDQFKRRSAESARLSYSGRARRYQPY